MPVLLLLLVMLVLVMLRPPTLHLKFMTFRFEFYRKCFIVFQKIAGHEILLLVLFLQEHGPDSLTPGSVVVEYFDTCELT